MEKIKIKTEKNLTDDYLKTGRKQTDFFLKSVILKNRYGKNRNWNREKYQIVNYLKIGTGKSDFFAKIGNFKKSLN